MQLLHGDQPRVAIGDLAAQRLDLAGPLLELLARAHGQVGAPLGLGLDLREHAAEALALGMRGIERGAVGDRAMRSVALQAAHQLAELRRAFALGLGQPARLLELALERHHLPAHAVEARVRRALGRLRRRATHALLVHRALRRRAHRQHRCVALLARARRLQHVASRAGHLPVTGMAVARAQLVQLGEQLLALALRAGQLLAQTDRLLGRLFHRAHQLDRRQLARVLELAHGVFAHLGGLRLGLRSPLQVLPAVGARVLFLLLELGVLRLELRCARDQLGVAHVPHRHRAGRGRAREQATLELRHLQARLALVGLGLVGTHLGPPRGPAQPFALARVELELRDARLLLAQLRLELLHLREVLERRVLRLFDRFFALAKALGQLGEIDRVGRRRRLRRPRRRFGRGGDQRRSDHRRGLGRQLTDGHLHHRVAAHRLSPGPGDQEVPLDPLALVDQRAVEHGLGILDAVLDQRRARERRLADHGHRAELAFDAIHQIVIGHAALGARPVTALAPDHQHAVRLEHAPRLSHHRIERAGIYLEREHYVRRAVREAEVQRVGSLRHRAAAGHQLAEQRRGPRVGRPRLYHGSIEQILYIQVGRQPPQTRIELHGTRNLP